jgi:Carboxypeptidase regulatory-like domain
VVISLTPFAGFLLLAVSLSAQTTAETGVIEGRVVDRDGTPVKAAKVNAELTGTPMAKAIRYVTADEAGTFLIDRLAFGTYEVFGMKEEEGFANTYWFSSVEAPRVTISAQQPSGNVLLMFGPKAGVIAGMVRDARTGKPVLAGFTVRRLSDSWFLSRSQLPNFRIFVPASTDVSLEVESPSYRTWAYMNPTSNSRELRLEPGGQMHLDITLIPQPDESRIARILVPEGYRGQLQLDCDIKDQPQVPQETGAKVFKFSSGGKLRTSSFCPRPGSENVYYSYSIDGSMREVSDNYWNGRGMIWGEYTVFRGGELRGFGFFVGTEEEYVKTRSR